MTLNKAGFDRLCKRLNLGKDYQEHAVKAALRSLLIEGKRGVVLADEVGFGKTYEALGTMALLGENAHHQGEKFDRVLILCKSSLLAKWQEELSQTRPDKGFPRYLNSWGNDHPINTLLKQVRVIRQRASANDSPRVREGGRLQAPAGIYVVNQDVLSAAHRVTRPFLRSLFQTEWDLIIVDEAHHYARPTQPSLLFVAKDGRLTGADIISGGAFKKVLALTATPFELAPSELVQLLSVVRADETDLATIKQGLDNYVRRLNHLFSIRHRSPDDELRKRAITLLKQLRDEDALAQGGRGVGLQLLLRKYLIRNTKSHNERRYFFLNRVDGKYHDTPFEKLEDMRSKVRAAPLLPFTGPDVLFYLELRELIEETIEAARDGGEHRTFITTDLRQGLSSYPQIKKSALLGRDLDSARRLKSLVEVWTDKQSERLHPKVVALCDLVQKLAEFEIEKVKREPDKWFSKVLIFNKMIGGTAPHLRQQLTERLEPLFAQRLEAVLVEKGWASRRQFLEALRASFKSALTAMQTRMEGRRDAQLCRVPTTFQHAAFVPHRGAQLVTAYRDTLLERTEQTLFMLRGAMQARTPTAAGLLQWLHTEVTEPFESALCHIIDYYLGDQPGKVPPAHERLEMAERECVVLLEECRSIEIVGRFDGGNARDREAHRRNFNNLYNPFALLVSRVGEEGIDLQKQCRYIIHYDLEWNPAKMEQREGRVDRIGYGRADEGPIIVYFMLLKGTYEERIFHAVNQRDEWFQVLIGSKKKEMGQPDDDETALQTDDGEEDVVVEEEAGRLTREEKAAVMIDLRPLSCVP